MKNPLLFLAGAAMASLLFVTCSNETVEPVAQQGEGRSDTTCCSLITNTLDLLAQFNANPGTDCESYSHAAQLTLHGIWGLYNPLAEKCHHDEVDPIAEAPEKCCP